MNKKFNDDEIRRDDLPRDVFELIHDLAYDHDGRDRNQYRLRAQQILKRKLFGESTASRAFQRWAKWKIKTLKSEGKG